MNQVQQGILNKIKHERNRQDRKWGEQNHEDAFWYVILGEEFGEVGRAIFEKDIEEVKDELVQVAAVAVAHLEAIERRGE